MRIYTVGWPRSGNQHLGVLLAGALGDQLPGFTVPRSRGGRTPDAECPAVCQTHCRAWHEPRTPFVYGNNTLAWPSLRDDERVVWIVRDPRNTAVSAWQMRRQSRDCPPDYALLAYLADYLTNANNPNAPMCDWRGFTEGWRTAYGRDPRVVRTSHEALMADREGELRRLLRALGLAEDDERIRESVKRETGRTRPAYDGSGEMVEAGRPEEWRAHFGTEEAWMLECHCGSLMRRLGYGRELQWQALTERA